ncbi:MAG: ABC transporter substrate-binding protein [Clostridiaceae bacterium]
MKKKQIISLVLASLMSVSLLAGCGADKDTSDSGKKVLKIWSFTDEVRTMTLAYEEANPDVKVEYTMIPMTNGEFQTKLKSALQTGDVPDVISLEASFVREYVESDYLADLGDLLPKAEELGTYQFTIDEGTYEGVTKAFSYQATPGAFFYRRSLAKEYFGTDDPAEIQEIVGDMDKFEAAAAVVKEKSNGDTFMVGSTGDFTNLFFSNRTDPWIVDDKLVIDPKIDDLFEIAKTFREKGYEAQAAQWAEGWFAGMNDSLVDAAGDPKQVFSYFLPTWGLPYVLMSNSAPKKAKDADGNETDTLVGKDTAGDWACINGPMPYQWGGTWIGVAKDSKNIELAKEFVEFATLNEDTLANWATGVYTNEYLKNIDDSIGDKLGQGAGDFVSSKKVVEKIMPKFDDSETTKFLAGQNSYSGFAEAAPFVSLELLQASDDAIQRSLNDPLANYVTGDATKDEAMTQFKEAVRNEFPEVTVE